MRVLHVDLGRELRGGQHQVLLLLKVLREAGHTSKLLARGPLLEHARWLGFDAAPASPMTLWRLSSEYELVHVHDAKSHIWAAFASRRPFVVSRRVAFPVSRSALSAMKYRRAARFLAVSQFVAEKLREAGIPRSKIDIVYDAVEAPECIKTWSAHAPVVALATFDPQKGRDLVELAAAIAGIPITFSSDLQKDLSYASAFLYVSRSEGFGSAALMAMSRGVPLIASHVGGLAEVFEDGVSGLAVENDPGSIAAALRRLLANPPLAQSLIEQASVRVAHLFNPTTLLTDTVTSYRRALAP